MHTPEAYERIMALWREAQPLVVEEDEVHGHPQRLPTVAAGGVQALQRQAGLAHPRRTAQQHPAVRTRAQRAQDPVALGVTTHQRPRHGHPLIAVRVSVSPE
jgi:hypothetical protein